MYGYVIIFHSKLIHIKDELVKEMPHVPYTHNFAPKSWFLWIWGVADSNQIWLPYGHFSRYDRSDSLWRCVSTSTESMMPRLPNQTPFLIGLLSLPHPIRLTEYSYTQAYAAKSWFSSICAVDGSNWISPPNGQFSWYDRSDSLWRCVSCSNNCMDPMLVCGCITISMKSCFVFVVGFVEKLNYV